MTPGCVLFFVSQKKLCEVFLFFLKEIKSSFPACLFHSLFFFEILVEKKITNIFLCKEVGNRTAINLCRSLTVQLCDTGHRGQNRGPNSSVFFFSRALPVFI